MVTRDLAVRRNYADNRAGGSITSDARDDAPWGCGWGNLIDGNQATVMETASPDSDADGEDLVNRTFTVTLSQPIDGAEVFIDPQACCKLADSSLAAYDAPGVDRRHDVRDGGGGMFDRHSTGT